MNLECEHGQLARSCNICEYEREIAELRARVGELEADLKINASMLARQHDRNMELEAARDEWRRIATEAKARVEWLLADMREIGVAE
jgi:hypothetical protein